MSDAPRDQLPDELTRLVQLAMIAHGLPVPEDAYFAIFARQVQAFVWWQEDRQAETGETVGREAKVDAVRDLQRFGQGVAASLSL
jgi:hypothetical protein